MNRILEQSTPKPQSESTSTGLAEEPLTVLVVDDDPVARELTVRTLSRQGFRVVQADGGHEGLRLARETRPSAVILDVVMPGIDGWTVLAELKKDPALARIPVIMVTMLDERNKGYAMGVTEYLLKPFDRTQLAGLLKRTRVKNGPGRVLIIDDDQTNREILMRLVSKEGWVAQEANNGQVGLELASQTVPDLIMLDLMMPVMDGFTFLRELRQRQALRAVSVVVLTAKDLTMDDHQQLQGSVHRVLRKGSYRREDLLREIRSQIGSTSGGLAPIQSTT